MHRPINTDRYVNQPPAAVQASDQLISTDHAVPDGAHQLQFEYTHELIIAYSPLRICTGSSQKADCQLIKLVCTKISCLEYMDMPHMVRSFSSSITKHVSTSCNKEKIYIQSCSVCVRPYFNNYLFFLLMQLNSITENVPSQFEHTGV